MTKTIQLTEAVQMLLTGKVKPSSAVKFVRKHDITKSKIIDVLISECDLGNRWAIEHMVVISFSIGY